MSRTPILWLCTCIQRPKLQIPLCGEELPTLEKYDDIDMLLLDISGAYLSYNQIAYCTEVDFRLQSKNVSSEVCS